MQINLSTRQLRAFVALADTRSFTRAAAACHLSQPAFSALVKQLEESVGVKLFDRSTRSVELTAEGVEFDPSARRLLADFGIALAGIGDRAARRRGRAAVALLPSLAADWLPAVLAGFHAAWPGIELGVSDVLSEACIESVRSGRSDFALATIRADTPELVAEPFCSDEFYLVCRADHALASASAIRPRDVAAFPFIHLSRTSSVRQYLDAATHPKTLASVLEVDQLATVSGMIRAGLGVSVVPALTLYQFAGPELVAKPLRWSGLKRHIYLVRRRDQSLSIAAQELHDWLVAHAPGKSPSRRR